MRAGKIVSMCKPNKLMALIKKLKKAKKATRMGAKLAVTASRFGLHEVIVVSVTVFVTHRPSQSKALGAMPLKSSVTSSLMASGLNEMPALTSFT